MTDAHNAYKRAQYHLNYSPKSRLCQVCGEVEIVTPKRVCDTCREARDKRRSAENVERMRRRREALPPAKCQVCGAEIQGNWTYCRAHKNAGLRRKLGEVVRFVPSPGIKAIPTSPQRKASDAERMDAIVWASQQPDYNPRKCGEWIRKYFEMQEEVAHV